MNFNAIVQTLRTCTTFLNIRNYLISDLWYSKSQDILPVRIILKQMLLAKGWIAQSLNVCARLWTNKLAWHIALNPNGSLHESSTQSSDLAPYHILFGKKNLPFDSSLLPNDGMIQDAKTHVTSLMKHLKEVRGMQYIMCLRDSLLNCITQLWPLLHHC